MNLQAFAGMMAPEPAQPTTPPRRKRTQDEFVDDSSDDEADDDEAETKLNELSFEKLAINRARISSETTDAGTPTKKLKVLHTALCLLKLWLYSQHASSSKYATNCKCTYA